MEKVEKIKERKNNQPVWCAICCGDGMGRDAHGTLSEPCKYCEGKGWVMEKRGYS